MDQDLSGRVPQQDVGAAVQELAPAHLAAGDRCHDTVLLVDHVHQLVSGIRHV
jgi:hypothetical protein